MRFEKAPRLRSFFKRYTFADMEDRIQTLIHNDLTELASTHSSLPDASKLIANGYLKDWKCYAEIRSLTEQPFPNLSEFATDSERLSATLNVEWGSPRFHCCIWSTDRSNPSNIVDDEHWILEGKFSLYKAFGYPYRIYYPFDLLTNNIAREFGVGVRFGFSMENAGYGFPNTSPLNPNKDTITFSGNWTQELVVISSAEPIFNINVGSSSPSPSPTPAPTPVVTLSPPSDVTPPILTWNNQNLTIAVTGLTANSSFTFQWFKGTTLVSTQTLQSDAEGKYNAVFPCKDFNASPFTGNGDYKIKVTQSGGSGESAAIAIKTMYATLSPTPTSTNPSTQITVAMFGTTGGGMFNWKMQKNNVDVGSSSFLFADTNPDVPAYATFYTNKFLEADYGTGSSNVYRVRFYNSVGVSGYSPTFTVT